MEKVNVYDIAVFLSIIDLPYLEERKLIKSYMSCMETMNR